MKKLLLLLALALTTAASFAQSPRPAAITPQATSDEEFEMISQELDNLALRRDKIMNKLNSFMYEHENCGNPYFEERAIALYSLLRGDIESFLNEYFPNNKYIGEGLTVESCMDICANYAFRLESATVEVEKCIYNFHEYYQPFMQEYAEQTALLKELTDKVLEAPYQIQKTFGEQCNYLQKYSCEWLFGKIEDSMKANTLAEDYENEGYGRRWEGTKVMIANLIACYEPAVAVQDAITETKDILNTDYADIKDEFSSILETLEWTDFTKLLEQIYEATLSDEPTQELINGFNELRATVERLKSCFEKAVALKKALDDAASTLENECPDVKDNYASQLGGISDDFSNAVKNGTGSAIRNQGDFDSFMSGLNDMLENVKKLLNEARAAQQGVSGIGAIEADGAVDAEFYNLQGVKVANPEAGMMLIKVDASGKAQKVIIR